MPKYGYRLIFRLKFAFYDKNLPYGFIVCLMGLKFALWVYRLPYRVIVCLLQIHNGVFYLN